MQGNFRLQNENYFSYNILVFEKFKTIEMYYMLCRGRFEIYLYNKYHLCRNFQKLNCYLFLDLMVIPK